MGDVPRDGRAPNRDEERDPLGANFALAAERGELRSLMVNAVRRGRWDVAEGLLSFARRPSHGLELLAELTDAIETGLAQLPEPRRARAAGSDELRALRLEAAESLKSRLRHLGLSPDDRPAMIVAARAFSRAQDHLRAAEMFEQAEDFASAAESWGALGELEHMEGALARVEALRHATLVPGRHWRDASERALHGDRQGALALLTKLPAEHADAAEARRLEHDLNAKLVRGGTLLLRASSGELLRVAELPATLGRDPSTTIPLRDPSISRQHARLTWVLAEGRFALEDLGSRGGILLGPARVAERLLLGEQGTFSLGATCAFSYQVTGGSTLRLTVTSGFDRGLVALMGPEGVALGEGGAGAFASTPEVRLSFAHGLARWTSPFGVRTWLADRPANPAIDLMHGDRIRLEPREGPPSAATLSWEVL